MSKVEDKHTLIYDTDLRRPACVLLQAAYGCGRYALRHFDARTWLTYPTPGMRKVAATDEQWAKLAEWANLSRMEDEK